jgi:hypothetical protein
MQKAEGLCQLLEVTEGSYKGSEDTETAPDGGRGFPTEKQMEEKVMLLQADMARREQERTRMEEEEQRKSKGNNWLKWK